MICLHKWGEASIWSTAKMEPTGAWIHCLKCRELAWIGLMPPPSRAWDDALFAERIEALTKARVTAAENREKWDALVGEKAGRE